jgi:cytosine/adenosine deaminase-related metal-dependent hydrolase
VGEFGGRAYVAHQYRAYVSYWDGTQSGVLLDDRMAFAGSERAKAFARRIGGTQGDRIRPYFFPYTLDASTPDLVRASKAADEFGTHMRTHFGQSCREIETIRQRYGQNPVDYLAGLGAPGHNVILTHVLYIAGNGPYDDPEDRDLSTLAESGTSVCHCPMNQGGRCGRQGGGQHVLLRGSDLALQGDRVAFAGPRYAGPVDDATDAAGHPVCPSFINLRRQVDLSHGPLRDDLARPDLYAFRPSGWLWDPQETPIFAPDEVRMRARLSMGATL